MKRLLNKLNTPQKPAINAKISKATSYEMLNEDPSEEEQPVQVPEELSILGLPMEMMVKIINQLDFPTRIAVKKSCRRLYNAEAFARLSVKELALYRTGDGEFTLSMKDAHSATWWLLQNVNGKNITLWKDDDETSRKLMKEDSRRTPFLRQETPLGEMGASLQRFVSKSTLDAVDIDGFHCSDSSMATLCDLLAGKPINHLGLSAPFSTTSDKRLMQLVYNSPQLRSITLAVHRCTPKAIVIDRKFLLLAASRLQKMILHSRPIREIHSVDSEIDDDLLLKLVSDKCSHLELLYFLSKLTGRGIVAAVECISKSKCPKMTLKAYFRRDFYYDVLRRLGVPDGGAFKPVTSVPEVCIVRARSLTLTKVTLRWKNNEYCQVAVEKEPFSEGHPIVAGAQTRLFIYP